MKVSKAIGLALAAAGVYVGILQYRKMIERPIGPEPVVVTKPPGATAPDGTVAERQPPVREQERQAPVAPELPVEFTLADGEQKVLLGGEVGLAVDFNRVGAKELLTLHISVAGEPATHHAILSGGGRYEFRAGGKTYVVSVLRWDARAQEAALRVDRKS